MPPMSKRIAAAVLWFFALWYLGAFIAFVLGVPDLLGPVLGLAGAALIAGDPLGVIWTRTTSESVTAEPPSPALGESLPTA